MEVQQQKAALDLAARAAAKVDYSELEKPLKGKGEGEEGEDDEASKIAGDEMLHNLIELGYGDEIAADAILMVGPQHTWACLVSSPPPTTRPRGLACVFAAEQAVALLLCLRGCSKF